MIEIENVTTAGWEPALRGMRNPMNSWEKSDTVFWNPGEVPDVGSDDHGLMMRLRNAGTDHRKFMRMIVCYADITAPLYWWKEFDTYRDGVEKNSCSTMHKIAEKEFTREDFSTEKLTDLFKDDGEPTYLAAGFTCVIADIIQALNRARGLYLHTKDKKWWWQMIQLLPSSYNQRRTVMMSYEALANMYKARKNHKLDEWKEFCKWAETLPCSELITGGERDGND